MPVRVAALVGASIALFGVLIYLFVAVRAASRVEAAAPRVAAPAAVRADDRDDSRAAEASARALDASPSASGSGPAPAAPPRALPSEPQPVATDLSTDPNLEMATAMDEANRLYDRSDYDAAQQGALRILERMPGNVRMLRLVVSSACIMGEPDKAQTYWRELPEHDRAQMTTRCARFGIALKE